MRIFCTLYSFAFPVILFITSTLVLGSYANRAYTMFVINNKY